MNNYITRLLQAAIKRNAERPVPAEGDYDFTAGGFYYSIVSIGDLTCEVARGEERYAGDIVIPTAVVYKGRTLSVTGIGECAFSGCKDVTSVVIQDGVTAIGDNAFAGCARLASIKIADSVASIGKSAFSGCAGMERIIIPNSVTTIEDSAFNGCERLKSISLGNGIESLNGILYNDAMEYTYVDTFQGCKRLEEIEVGNGYAMRWLLKNRSDISTLVIAGDYSDAAIPTSFDTYRLSGCSRLTRIVSKTAKPLSLGRDISNAQYMNVEVVVPTKSLAHYQAHDAWKHFWELKGGAEHYE